MAKKDREEKKSARKAKREVRVSDKAKIKAADNYVPPKRKPVKPVPAAPSKTEERIDARPSQASALKEELGADKFDEAVATSGMDVRDPQSTAITRTAEGGETFDKANESATNGKVLGEVARNANKVAEEEDLAITEASVERQKDKEATRNTEAGVVGLNNALTGVLDDVPQGEGGQYGMTDEEWERSEQEIRNISRSNRANAPGLATEQLGIEHYYPPQKTYQSNFTGRYIGSRQITASGGALIPGGLANARNNALANKAKSKAEAKEKFWEFTNTAPQWDAEYKDYVMDGFGKYFEASGGDVNSLLRGDSKMSREFIRFKNNMESKGRDMIELSAQADAIMAIDPSVEYVPPQVLKWAMKIRSAQFNVSDFMEGKFDGETNFRKIKNGLRSYQNINPLINKKVTAMIAHPDTMPLAAGTDLSDPEAARTAMEAIEQVNTRDYTEFVQATEKHIDIGRVRGIVEGLYEHHDLYEGTTPEEYEEQIDIGVMSMVSMFPTQIDVNTTFQKTENLGYLKESRYRYEFSKHAEWTERDYTNLYDDVETGMTSPEYTADMNTAAAKVKPSSGTAADNIRYKNDYNRMQASVMAKHNISVSTTRGYNTSILPTAGDAIVSVPTTGNSTRIWDDEGKPTTAGRRLRVLKDKTNKSKNDIAEIEDLNYLITQSGQGVKMNVTQEESSHWTYMPGLGKAIPSNDPRVKASDLADPTRQVDKLEQSGAFRMPRTDAEGNPVVNEKGERLYRASTINVVNQVNLSSPSERRGAAAANKKVENKAKGKAYKEERNRYVGSSGSSGSGE